MPPKNNLSVSHLLYPYMFMLKEGPEFKQDFLDYSLLILHTKPETLPSPEGLAPRETTTVEVIRQEFPF